MTYIDIDVNGLKSLINHLYKTQGALKGSRTLEAFVKNTKLDLDNWKSDIYLPYHNDLPMTNWYKTFAWFPTETMDCGLVWMRHIWKRRVKHRNLVGPPTYYTQYLAFGPGVEVFDINTMYPQTSGIVSTDEARKTTQMGQIFDETLAWIEKHERKQADGGAVLEIKNEPMPPYSPYYGINYKSDPFGEEK